MKDLIRKLIDETCKALTEAGQLPAVALPDYVIERTRNKSHGDFAVNIALQLAKIAQRKPREVAELIVAKLPAHADIAKVEIAGPGFINLFLHADALTRTVARVLDNPRYGFAEPGSRASITVEYVSANPNGPLHVGHGRGAAYGSSLASLLEAGGYTVHREYYVNDAGRQMDILACSVWLRYIELGGDTIRFPDNGYKGDYVHGIARELRLNDGGSLHRPAAEVLANLPLDETQGGDKEAHVDALIVRARAMLGDAEYQRLFNAGLKACLSDIKDDLAGFGVTYDNWFSERSLSTSGAVQRAIDVLKSQGHMYEQNGALWFRATTFGDEKDRVVVRENGATTYFASDIAYLLNKFDRGFERAIYVFGADHHGYVARLKAAAQGLGVDPNRLEIKLVQFAILFEGGEKQQMSTRAGRFVTLRDLREDIGKDAARFFYVMRSHDQHLDFDLDLARSQSLDNPVHYLHYTHARLCGIFRNSVDKGLGYDPVLARSALSELSEPQAIDVLQKLAAWPELVEAAVENRSPHLLVNALRELASSFNGFYNEHTVLVESGSLRCARMALAEAVRQVLRQGLSVIGVSAPERI